MCNCEMGLQEMAALPMGQPRERRLVELNVVESCLNLFKVRSC